MPRPREGRRADGLWSTPNRLSAKVSSSVTRAAEGASSWPENTGWSSLIRPGRLWHRFCSTRFVDGQRWACACRGPLRSMTGAARGDGPLKCYWRFVMKKLLSVAVLGLLGAAIIGCEASGSIDAEDDADRDVSYKKTTVKSDDGDTKTTKTEIRRDND